MPREIKAMNDFFNGPFLIVAVVMAVTAIIFWRIFLREQRQFQAKERFERRQCVSCGYDLRASDDSCPECGFPIQAPDLPLTLELSVETMNNNWPEESIPPRKPRPDESRIEIYASENERAVHVLSLQLEARGMPSEISERRSRLLDPITLVEREYHEFRLSIGSNDLEKATDIIQSFSAARLTRLARDRKTQQKSVPQNA
jgi:hypothetical protein